MTEAEIERAAAKLTEAMKRALLHREPVSFGGDMLAGMEVRGLVERDQWGIAVFTPLGLAVRAHLQGEG